MILESDLDFDGMLRLCISLGGNASGGASGGGGEGAGGGGGGGGGGGSRLELQPLLELAELLVGYAGEAGREATQGLP